MNIQIIQLVMALAAVETGGHPNPPQAIGDGGRSVGILQISKAVVDDVNNFKGYHYTYEDRTDVQSSVELCIFYLDHWGNHYTKKTGKPADVRTLAQIWNGGALAWKKTDPKVVKNLTDYWNKVRFELIKKGVL